MPTVRPRLKRRRTAPLVFKFCCAKFTDENGEGRLLASRQTTAHELKTKPQHIGTRPNYASPLGEVSAKPTERVTMGGRAIALSPRRARYSPAQRGREIKLLLQLSGGGFSAVSEHFGTDWSICTKLR